METLKLAKAEPTKNPAAQKMMPKMVETILLCLQTLGNSGKRMETLFKTGRDKLQTELKTERVSSFRTNVNKPRFFSVAKNKFGKRVQQNHSHDGIAWT